MRAHIDAGEAVAGTAEALPLPASSVDCVFAADAFHWFDTEQAVAEYARVLRSGGVAAIFWNRTDPADNIVPQDVLPPSPRSARRFIDSGEWRNAFSGGRFEQLREASVIRERRLSRAALLDYFASMSPFVSLPADEREPALTRLADALHEDEYTQRWRSVLYWTRHA
jgi:SAM-dependent methyltransferase